MAQQTINVGAAPNDGTGTPLRTAFQYTNSNFSELYTAVGPSGNNIVVPGNATITGDLTVDTNVLKVDTTNDRVGINTTNTFKPLTVQAGSTGSATINQGLVINSSAAYGVGQGVSYSSLVFSRNRSIDTASLTASVEIYGGNSAETTSLGGFLGFRTQNAAGTLTDRYTIDNTGISTWSVGGSTAMTLNSTGLGVGASPGERLTIQTALTGTTVGSNTVGRFQSNGSGYDAHIALGDNVNPSARIGYLSSAMYFWTNGAERVRIDPSGNVGVGVAPITSHILSAAGPVGISGTNAGTRTSYISNANACSIYYTDGGGAGYFTDFGNLIIQPRTSAARSVVIATGSTTPVERAVVKSTGQVRFVPLAADPSGAESGDVYYNSTSNKLKCYDGTSWNDLF